MSAVDDDAAAQLIRAIEEHPYDSNVYAVYGDWLAEHGDLRGELIALQIAAERDPDKTSAAEAFFAEHAEHFLGNLFGYTLLDPNAFTWRYGFIHRARFMRYFDDGFRSLSSHPSGRFVVELAVGTAHAHELYRLDDFLELLRERAPPTLHALSLGDTKRDTRFRGAALDSLWPHVRALRRLVVDGGEYEIGSPDLPTLEHLALQTSGHQPVNLRTLARAKLPALRALRLAGDDARRHHGGVQPLTEGTEQAFEALVEANPFPQLRHLSIPHCQFSRAAVQALTSSPLLAQLESLDLSHGTLGNRGAALLRARGMGLLHLGSLDLSYNGIDDTHGLASLAHRVILDPQS